MVQLYLNVKSRTDIVREYDLLGTALDRWIKQHQTSGSFNEKNNRFEDEIELIKLRKELQQLHMGKNILKQVTLIMERM